MSTDTQDADIWGGIATDATDAAESALVNPFSPQADGPKGVHDAIIFDIETGPLPDAELWKVVAPFDPASLVPFGEFNPADVKTGNLKDAAKIAEKIEAARAQHALDAAAHELKNAGAEVAYKADVISKAALSAITGRVLAIGYFSTKNDDFDIDIINAKKEGDEVSLISYFWSLFEAADEHTRFIGHNIAGFDIPFLFQRSCILGIEVPRGIFDGRYLSKKFVDTMLVWACGKGGSNSFTKLDDLAKAFGVGAKNGSGAMFAELLATDPKAAREYLANDIAITYAVARRMRLCK